MPEKSTPARIIPGDKFDVVYGDCRTATVVALGLGDQRKLATVVRKLIALEEDQTQAIDIFDYAEEALRLAMPKVTEEFLNEIDAEMAIEIATKTLGKQAVSEDEQKK